MRAACASVIGRCADSFWRASIVSDRIVS